MRTSICYNPLYQASNMSRPGEASTLSSNDSTETNLEPIRTPVPITSTPGNDRLSIPYMLRLPTAILFSSFSGFLLGAAHGGSTSALRFRAENAHRLPTSQVGWYLYHKSKNYHVMLGGIKEGLRMGFKVGFWSGSFFAMEEAVDRLRGAVVRGWVGFKERRRGEERELGLEKMEGEDEVWVQRDFLSSVVAALGTAGGFSAWSKCASAWGGWTGADVVSRSLSGPHGCEDRDNCAKAWTRIWTCTGRPESDEGKEVGLH